MVPSAANQSESSLGTLAQQVVSRTGEVEEYRATTKFDILKTECLCAQSGTIFEETNNQSGRGSPTPRGHLW
eukprot:gene10475-2605_t